MKGSSRKLAAISLLVMCFGFVAALYMERVFYQGNVWVLLFMSGFEAGLVGGLADWFAVTALFRHPFGIPIPHTAILPQNRERVTNALISMVENDLLNKKSIQDKLQTLDIVRLGLGAARKGLENKSFKTALVQALRSLLTAIPQEQVQRLLREAILSLLEKAELGQLLQALADEALHRKMDEALLDLLLEKTLDMMQQEKFQTDVGNVAVHAAQQMPHGSLMLRSVPAIIGMMGPKRTGKMIQEFLLAAGRDLMNPENDTRQQMLTSLRSSAQHIAESETLLVPLRKSAVELASGEELETQIQRSVAQMIQKWSGLLDTPEVLDSKVIPFVDELLVKAEQNVDLVNRLESFLDEQLVRFIDSHHEDIGRLIRENVNRFDTKKLVEKIEGKFGNDLQWIRVNGAICGFAVGMLLYGFKSLVLILFV